jgi:uncharacterized protein YciI
MGKQFYVLHLLPLRPDFAQTMTDSEKSVMKLHVDYWMVKMKEGKVYVFGPVMDPEGIYGLGIIAVENEEELQEFMKNDPASVLNKYAYFPMRAVVPEHLTA